ncbi:hypothetical protein GY45DRAFT_377603 [Cubamyces sp. BRFM 1775]|nr:hypothetical protein GY45DRAFT_377603 [Cubamyces sp. BRFM 1775]
MSTVSAKSQYHLRPVSTIHPRDASPATSSSTTSDRSPPLSAHHHSQSKAFLPPASATFSPIPTSARPRRPLSPTSLRVPGTARVAVGPSADLHRSPFPPLPSPTPCADVDPPLDPERAFAARGKFPAPPTGHELMALFPPAPPPIRPGPTSGYFQREERQFFAQAGKEIVRVRIEIETPAAVHSHPHPHPHPHAHANGHPHPHAHAHGQQQQQAPPLPPPPAAPLSGPGTGSPTHMLPQPPPQHRHPHAHPHAHQHRTPRTQDIRFIARRRCRGRWMWMVRGEEGLKDKEGGGWVEEGRATRWSWRTTRSRGDARRRTMSAGARGSIRGG